MCIFLQQDNKNWSIKHSKVLLLNPDEACMRQRTGSAFVLVMACGLLGAKPLPEPLLIRCQLDDEELNSAKIYEKSHLLLCLSMDTVTYGAHCSYVPHWTVSYNFIGNGNPVLVFVYLILHWIMSDRNLHIISICVHNRTVYQLWVIAAMSGLRKGGALITGVYRFIGCLCFDAMRQLI